MSCSHRATTMVELDERVAFMCDGCLEVGYGTRYNCSSGCDYTLHVKCEMATPEAYHPLFDKSLFFLQLNEPPIPNRLCEACGTKVKGWRYRYTGQSRSIFLHPGCMKGPRSINIGDEVLSLTKKLESIACTYCKRTSLGEDVNGWAYVSGDQTLGLHVKCMKDKLHEKWTINSKQNQGTEAQPRSVVQQPAQQSRSVVQQPAQQPRRVVQQPNPNVVQQPRVNVVQQPNHNVVPQQYVNVGQQPDNNIVQHYRTVVSQPDNNGIQHHHHYYHVIPHNCCHTVAPPEQHYNHQSVQQQNYNPPMTNTRPARNNTGAILGKLTTAATEGLINAVVQNPIATFSVINNMLGSDSYDASMLGSDSYDPNMVGYDSYDGDMCGADSYDVGE